MSYYNPPTFYENYENAIEPVRRIGTAGYVVGFNFRYRGPEFFESTYPEEWQRLYDERNYYGRDPVLLWAITTRKGGEKRWSSIPFPNPGKLPFIENVPERAAEHGLKYGAIVARNVNGRRSALSVAREDREVTNQEISILAHLFDELTRIVDGSCGLNDKELSVLKALNDGHTDATAADLLGIPLPTLKSCKTSARKKLGCKTSTQAVGLAVRRNYIN
ncbi:MAG: autoinducer binding domain-containing protein [Rhodobacteraceae bacterium]|jgi:LuxR family transcriptional regulator|nr:autoinducer binding domain-containing protein [Paracoccaceae bacterium]